MKFVAIAALVATTQAKAIPTAAWNIPAAPADKKEENRPRCIKGYYPCAIISCTGSDEKGENGDVCIPDTLLPKKDTATNTLTGAANDYEKSDTNCVVKADCDPANSASVLIASAAAVATAIYTLA